MIGVDQRITAHPGRPDGANAAGVPGDCLRAAVATLIEQPYEAVPHFALHGRRWWDALRRYARTLGGDFACVPAVDGSIRYALADGDGHVIARGLSPRGRPHAVITDFDLHTVWDPHPSRAGLAAVDEAYVHCPPYWPPPQQHALTAGGTAVLINLTPHPIRVYPPDAPDRINPGAVPPIEPVRVIDPAMTRPARVVELEAGTWDLDGIPVVFIEPSHVAGLPPYVGDVASRDRTTWYIVSRPVALRVPHRRDLLVPYREVRNLDGTVIGCRQLAQLV